jgi:hypothetical protein
VSLSLSFQGALMISAPSFFGLPFQSDFPPYLAVLNLLSGFVLRQNTSVE